jgi:hypothetical protein
MPFLDRRDGSIDVPSWKTPSMGNPSDASEIFVTEAKKQRYNESYRGHADLLQQEYESQSDLAKAVGAGDLPDADPQAWSLLARKLEGTPGASPWEITEDYILDDFKRLEEYSQRLEDLKKSGKSVSSGNDMWSSSKGYAKQLEYDSYRESEVGGLGTEIIKLAGGIAGYSTSLFTRNDPTIYFTAVGGKSLPSVAATVAREAGLNAVVEGVNQFTGVSLNKKLLGMEATTGQKIANIATAAIFAGGVRGAGELAGPAFRSLEMKVAPNRAFARQLRDHIENTTLNPVKLVDTIPNYSKLITDADNIARIKDIEERSLAYEAQQAQRMREAISAYGLSDEAFAHAAGVLHDSERIFNGESPLSETAVGRVFNKDGQTIFDFPDLPTAMEKDIVDTARGKNPEAFTKLDELHAKVNEIEVQMKAKQEEMSSLTVGDFLRSIDEDTGIRVKAIEDELDSAIPKKRRADLEAELDSIVSNFDSEHIAASADTIVSRIAGEIETLRRQRKPINTEINKAKKVVETAVRHERNGRKVMFDYGGAKERLQKLGTPVIEYKKSADVLSEVRANIRRAEEFPQEKAVDAAYDRAVPDKDGVIDFGGFKAKETDLVPMMDVDGNYKFATVKEVLEDIKNDEAALRAMKECSL